MSLSIRFFSLALFLLSAFVLLAQPNNTNDQAGLYLKRGKEAFANGKFQESIDHFNRSIQLKPHYLPLTYRGNAYLVLKNYDLAEKDLSRAVDYYLRSGAFRAPDNGFQMGPMRVIQPGQSQEVSLALLYNNRGIARYFQGRRNEAIEDFNAALEINPGLQTATRNRAAALQGASLPNGSGAISPNNSNGSTIVNSGGRYENQYNRYSRPVSVPQPSDPRSNLNQAEDLRELRTIVQDEGVSRGLFGPRLPREFEGRDIPRKGKFYRNPPVQAKSQSYIYIDNVKITERSTFVRLRVENQEEKAFFVSLEAKGSPGAFYLTDRTGNQRSIYRLKSMDKGIATYPKTTTLKPGEPVYVTLEFEKIPDTLGFVNLIEGSRENNQAWNFYQVDLTR